MSGPATSRQALNTGEKLKTHQMFAPRHSEAATTHSFSSVKTNVCWAQFKKSLLN